jgi:hypothetical protein
VNNKDVHFSERSERLDDGSCVATRLSREDVSTGGTFTAAVLTRGFASALDPFV